MRKQRDADKLISQMAAIRELIETHTEVQQLLDLAADEADRRAVTDERSRRIAWRVTGAFGGLAVAAFAIAWGAVQTSMRPAPPPEVLVVDKAGGVVQPLISLADFQMSPEEATIRRNIDTLVTACEGYSYEQADTHYYHCAAFLSPQLQAEWARKWDKSNPESPPNKFKKERKVRTKVGAITVLRNGLGVAIGARASFTRTETLNGVEDPSPSTWVANLSFRWVNQPTNERDRRVNDLGMEVTDYTSDRDLTATKPAPPPTPVRQASHQTHGSQMALVAPGNAQGVTP
ncbi:virB8 family protein [Massilia sp. DD77]|uniref:virB8 family protein n=1 Tax=Massilia sp. DD77 TaxID=3109349 RepID=UPI003000EB9B